MSKINIPAGWKLVPVEPTEAMLIAARDWSICKLGRAVGNDGSSGCYAAMLAAAPTPPVDAVLGEPVATVVEPHPSGPNYLAWYSNRAMNETPACAKLYAAPLARVPLDEGQLRAMRSMSREDQRCMNEHWWVLFARAIEAAHGITAPTTPGAEVGHG